MTPFPAWLAMSGDGEPLKYWANFQSPRYVIAHLAGPKVGNDNSQPVPIVADTPENRKLLEMEEAP